jgi:hypothetical protein
MTHNYLNLVGVVIVDVFRSPPMMTSVVVVTTLEVAKFFLRTDIFWRRTVS